MGQYRAEWGGWREWLVSPAGWSGAIGRRGSTPKGYHWCVFGGQRRSAIAFQEPRRARAVHGWPRAADGAPAGADAAHPGPDGGLSSTTEDPEGKAPEHPYQLLQPRFRPGRRGTRGGHGEAAGWRSFAELVGVLAIASLRGTEGRRRESQNPHAESTGAGTPGRGGGSGVSRLTLRAVRVRPKLVCGVS